MASRRLVLSLAVLVLLQLSTGPAHAVCPDVVESYFFPQAGPVGAPTNGLPATRFFRACPNNDGGSSLPNAARIKVVVEDAAGVGIPGIPAAEICVVLNGGTAAQGFAGPGADSVISNGTWNFAPLCPDLFCISADGPTDAAGETYITFTGSAPGAPGTPLRDPRRKWGHYDDILPVSVSFLAMGCAPLFIDGRETPLAAAGGYTLRIKNFDHVGGLGAFFNQGEVVSAADFNSLVSCIGGGCINAYWKDFDSSGTITATDFNSFVVHLGHDCDTPLFP